MSSAVKFLLLNVIQYCLGQGMYDSNVLLKFIEDFNFQHLDSMTIDAIEIELTDGSSDENLAGFTEGFGKLKKLTSFQKSEKCIRPALKIISISSILPLNNTECQIKGQFIRDTCQTYLIFVFENISLDVNFFLKIRCNFLFQPIIHILKNTQPLVYDLYEIQVFSQRYIHLALWNIKENIMWYVKILPSSKKLYVFILIFQKGIGIMICISEEKT